MGFQELCLLCYETQWLRHNQVGRVAQSLLWQQAVYAVDAAVIQNQHQRPDAKDIIVLRIAPTQQRVDATDVYSVVVYIVSNCYAYALTYYLYYYILYND